MCFDERPCQLLDDVVAGLRVEPGKAAKEDNEYVRQGTAVVLLAYDMDRGIRYTQTRKQRTSGDYAEFMEQIISTYYADAGQIDLVQDNLNTHKYGSFLYPSACESGTGIKPKAGVFILPRSTVLG